MKERARFELFIHMHGTLEKVTRVLRIAGSILSALASVLFAIFG